MSLMWNKDLSKQIQREVLTEALERIDGAIELRSKQELYPGHGKITGTLQRGIQSFPIRQTERGPRGAVGVKGVKYALAIHKRYRYIIIGLDDVRPRAPGIVASVAARRRA